MLKDPGLAIRSMGSAEVRKDRIGRGIAVTRRIYCRQRRRAVAANASTAVLDPSADAKKDK